MTSFIYRCRKCGAEFPAKGVSDDEESTQGIILLAHTLNDHVGSQMPIYVGHGCPAKKTFGVADLIGIQTE